MSLSERFEEAPSWTVHYGDAVYTDARQIDGTWYYRSAMTGEVTAFGMQDLVQPVHPT